MTTRHSDDGHRRIFFVAFAALLVFLQLSCVDEYVYRGKAYTTAPQVPVRRQPRTGDNVVKWLNSADTLTVLSGRGQWWRVRFGRTEGYVFSSYLSVADPRLNRLRFTGEFDCPDLSGRWQGKLVNGTSIIIEVNQTGCDLEGILSQIPRPVRRFPVNVSSSPVPFAGYIAGDTREVTFVSLNDTTEQTIWRGALSQDALQITGSKSSALNNLGFGFELVRVDK